MRVLEGVAQRTQDLARYRSRQDAKRMEMLREKNDREREQLVEVRAELQQTSQRLDQAQREAASLRQKLIDAGLDPDA